MFLQGNLQAVFDALYTLGAIDPILKLDWNKVTQEMMREPQRVSDAFQTVNACRGDENKLIQKLANLDQKTLSYIAMEVARELSDFQDRKEMH